MSDAKRAWDDVGEEFSALGRRLQRHFRREQADTDRSDVEDAIRAMADGVNRALDAVGEAVRDPSVQEDARRVARSLADAVSATLNEVGEELRGAFARDEDRRGGESGGAGGGDAEPGA